MPTTVKILENSDSSYLRRQSMLSQSIDTGTDPMATYHRQASSLAGDQRRSDTLHGGFAPTLRLKAIGGALLFGASFWAGVLYLVFG